MEWFNFQDSEFVLFFLLMIVLLVFLVTFIVLFSLSGKRYVIHQKQIHSESNNFRIYVINVKRNTVTYFSRSNLKDKRIMNIQEFYDCFDLNDREKIKQWIFNICSRVDFEPYLEADAFLEKEKATYFSLLKLVKYDNKNGMIHIENHILRYITPHSVLFKRKKGVVTGVMKRSVMEQMIAKGKSLYGFTFSIRFFYIKQKVLSNDKVERYMAMTLKNEIYPFASSSQTPRQIVDISNNELVLEDMYLPSKDDAMRLATSISHSLERCIAINGFENSVGFSIGIVENALFFQNFKEMVNHSQEASVAAQQSGTKILFYQKTTSLEIDKEQYKENINDLIRSRKIRYLFRPIVDVINNRVLGFFEYVRAYDSPFASYVEMSRYAAKVNENKNLLAHVCHHLLPKFNSEKPTADSRLFFSISMNDIPYITEIVEQITNLNQCKLVLLLDEQEVNENASDLEALNQYLTALHVSGFELALLLEDKNLLLDPSAYYNFDYFVAGANMMGEVKMNNRIRLSIHTLIESLLKFKKPIVATDLDSWSAIELIIKSGITLVSSESLAASNDMLLPVEKKKMEKICAMGEKYK